MTNEEMLDMWRSMPTPEGWQMDDLILHFGRSVERRAMAEMSNAMFSTSVPATIPEETK